MTIDLIDAERDVLVGLLESAIKDVRVEVRRTRNPTFHDRLVEEEHVMKDLLKKIDAT